VSESSLRESKAPSKLWLPFVLVTGIFVGVVLSSFVPQPIPFFWRYAPFGLEPILRFHIVLSTVSIALLVALTAIYVRVCADTGARFALGVVVVLLALLVESLFQYPLLLGISGPLVVAQGGFLSFADVFTIIAYAVFLYLSLE
jgi:hypothetical protein